MNRKLWLARNWLRVGRPAAGPAPGVVVVFARGRENAVTSERLATFIGDTEAEMRSQLAQKYTMPISGDGTISWQ